MLSAKIDAIIEQKSLLGHIFYQTWSQGELTLDALRGYSQEYFQIVKSVPELMIRLSRHVSSGVKKEEINNIILEEKLHIQFWIDFAEELGISPETLSSYEGLEKTQKAVRNLFSLVETFHEGAIAMYALEKEIPVIAEVKLKGLKEFYNFTSKKGLKYFNLHTEADIRHAKSWRTIINNIPSEKRSKMLTYAHKSLDAQHLLLDACYEHYC